MGSPEAVIKKNYIGWKLFLASVVACCAAVYYVHVPLPEDVAHRDEMHFVGIIVPLMFRLPTWVLGYIGMEWQVWYERKFVTIMGLPDQYPSLDDNDVHIEDTVFDGVPVRVYVPKGNRVSRGAFMFFHGGAFVLMDVSVYDQVTRQLAKLLKMVVVSVEYRLAPEHPFPAGVNDCEVAVLHLMNAAYKLYDVDPDQIIVAGDSAGGNLAAVVAQRLHRKRTQNKLKAQVLIYPVIQLADLQTPSYQDHHSRMSGSAMLDPRRYAAWLLMYFGQEPTPELLEAVLSNNHTSAKKRLESGWVEHAHHDHLPANFAHSDHYKPPPTHHGDPKISSIFDELVFHPNFTPLLAKDLSGLPPTMMITMQYDILRDEGYWYMRRLQQAGVETVYKHYEHGFHGVLSMHKKFAMGRQVMEDIVAYVHSQVH